MRPNQTKQQNALETRIACTNWDEETPVALKASGRGRLPARKVLTKGVVKIALNRPLAERIATMLGCGYEVQLTVNSKEAFRMYPCAKSDFKSMFLRCQAMGEFGEAIYRGRKLTFTSRRGYRRIEREEVDERVERAKREAADKREHVTPDSVVTCPQCGYEFRVGKTLV